MVETRSMTQESRNSKLYEYIEYESEDGPGVTTPMDSLINQAAALQKADAAAGHRPGEVCPRCGNWGVLFFGDPASAHWCAACQIDKDFDMERG